MADFFDENLVRQWRTDITLDAARYAVEVARRRSRRQREAVLAATGVLLLIALAIAFGVWAITEANLMMAVSAVAFAAGVPLLLSVRARSTGLLKEPYEASPNAHIAALMANLDDERRRLGEARACALILAASAMSALGLFALHLAPGIALVPISAWAITATAIEIWRTRAARRLKRNRAVLDGLAREAEGAADPDARE